MKKEGEGAQGGQGIHAGESGMEEEWGMDMDVEDGIESAKSWMQVRKLQKELRDIVKFSCVPKEVQESLKSNLQQQLQEVEQKEARHHARAPESADKSQNIHSIHDKKKKYAERNCCNTRGDAEDLRGN